MDKNIIKEFIKNIELFAELDEQELGFLAEKITIEKFAKDTILFSENNPRKQIFVIYEGEVELFKRTPFGEEKRLSFFRKKDFLGEGAIMDDSPHSTSARALLDTTSLTISKKDITELFNTHGSFAVKIFSHVAKVISRRMRHTTNRVITSGAQFCLFCQWQNHLCRFRHR